jgi:hypothetical protein
MFPLTEERIMLVPNAGDLCEPGCAAWNIDRLRTVCQMRTYHTPEGATFDIVVFCPEQSADEVSATNSAMLHTLADEWQASIALEYFAGRENGAEGATYASEKTTSFHEGNPIFIGVFTREFFASYRTAAEAWYAVYEDRLECTALGHADYTAAPEELFAGGMGHFEEMDWFKQVIVARWDGVTMAGRAFAVDDLYGTGPQEGS